MSSLDLSLDLSLSPVPGATGTLQQQAGALANSQLNIQDTTSLYVARAGTGLNATDTDPVGLVVDSSRIGQMTVAEYMSANSLSDPLSVPGIHWQAAADDTTRPTLGQTAGGIWRLEFDGSNDVLYANATISMVDAYFAVLFDATSGQGVVFGSDDNNYEAILSSGGATTFLFTGTGDSLSYSEDPKGTEYYYSTRFNSSSGAYIRRNGVAQASGSTGAPKADQALKIGARNATEESFFNGDFYGGMVTIAELPGGSRDTVESWLATLLA